jgi:hemerythrin-like domain-containing protein
MKTESLAATLERDHREIDDGIKAFTAAPHPGERDRQRLVHAIRALRRHIYLEEQFLFPPLRHAGLAAPVAVMLREHAQIWTTLDALQRELDTGTDRLRALALCHQLSVQLLHHNLKEEKALYPPADQILTESASAQLRTFFEAGELPDGWVCAKAQPRAG